MSEMGVDDDNVFEYKVGDVWEYQHQAKQRWIIEEKCLDFWDKETGYFRCRPLAPLLYDDIQTCYWHENQIRMWGKLIKEQVSNHKATEDISRRSAPEYPQATPEHLRTDTKTRWG